MSARDGGARKSSDTGKSRTKKRVRPRKGKRLLEFDSNRVKGLCRRVTSSIASILPVKAAANATFTGKDVAMALAYASCSRLFLEGTAAQLNLLGLAPSADRLVALVSRVPWIGLLESFRRENERILRRAQTEGKITARATLGLDMHRVPRYRRKEERYKGKRKARDMPMAVAGKHVAGTNLAHQFATIETVGEQTGLTFEVIPWFHGSSYRQTISDLLASATRWVDVDLLLMDREFFNVESVGACLDAGVHFLTPATKNARVKRAIERCKGLSHVVEKYEMGGRIVNLVVVDRECIGKGKGYWAFATDLPEERWRELSLLYSQRWGIESGYRDKKSFRARTCSLSYQVRLFLFLVSVLAATIWTLERDDGPVSWLDRMPAHLVRFVLMLFVLARYEPDLLELVLAVMAEAD